MAGCCARAVSGHAATAPPRTVMELAADHSITSSARAIRVSGSGDIECLGGLQVHYELEFHGALEMGKFPGGVPFKILSTKAAER